MVSNYSAYFALEKQVKIKTKESVTREELISQFTDNRKSSLKELTDYEYKQFLNWLKTAFKITSNTNWQATPENRMRRKIIGFFKSMHFVHKDSRADMDRIDQWCMRYSPEHKSLNDHSKTELIKLVSQVELVYQSFIKSLNK